MTLFTVLKSLLRRNNSFLIWFVLVRYQMVGYPGITKNTLEILSSFEAAYLCEHDFSILVGI